MKIVTVLGARPQFIKAGTVSREIARQGGIEEIIVHTGQHYDANMSDIFFEEMAIPRPDYHLGIGGCGHGAMTGRMMERIEEVLLRERPDGVMVYGDTDSTLAGALAAVKLHVPVVHVEAGLRSFNMQMPEEINRILTDRISRLLFCPTDRAVANLEREGFGHFGCEIVKSGDVMYDGALFYRARARRPEGLAGGGAFWLCTVHRAENTDDPERLRAIFSALRRLAEEERVVLPLHPRTRKKLADYGIESGRVEIMAPCGYLEMVWLLTHCRGVITDSGGLQKEAFFFHKPCVTLRDETEWVELVEQGFNVLAGADEERIVALCRHHTFNDRYETDLYGAGDAACKIVARLGALR